MELSDHNLPKLHLFNRELNRMRAFQALWSPEIARKIKWQSQPWTVWLVVVGKLHTCRRKKKKCKLEPAAKVHYEIILNLLDATCMELRLVVIL